MIVRLALGLSLAAAAAAPAFADGDPAEGEKVFRRCQACHVADAEQNRVGPYLKGVVGRKAASVEGYNYSAAMKEAGENGLEWTEENIDKYLADPKGFIPKNKMAFAGLKKEDEREDVIAFLKQHE
jgi:cytochrome c